jgi:hypothetical protein
MITKENVALRLQSIAEDVLTMEPPDMKPRHWECPPISWEMLVAAVHAWNNSILREPEGKTNYQSCPDAARWAMVMKFEEEENARADRRAKKASA